MAEIEVPAEVIYQGIPASPGISIGLLHVMARGFSAPEVYEIEESETLSARGVKAYTKKGF